MLVSADTSTCVATIPNTLYRPAGMVSVVELDPLTLIDTGEPFTKICRVVDVEPGVTIVAFTVSRRP